MSMVNRYLKSLVYVFDNDDKIRRPRQIIPVALLWMKKVQNNSLSKFIFNSENGCSSSVKSQSVQTDPIIIIEENNIVINKCSTQQIKSTNEVGSQTDVEVDNNNKNNDKNNITPVEKIQISEKSCNMMEKEENEKLIKNTILKYLDLIRSTSETVEIETNDELKNNAEILKAQLVNLTIDLSQLASKYQHQVEMLNH